MRTEPTHMEIKTLGVIGWAINRLPEQDKAERIIEGDPPRIHPGPDVTRLTWGHDADGSPRDLFTLPTVYLTDDSISLEQIYAEAELIPEVPDYVPDD